MLPMKGGNRGSQRQAEGSARNAVGGRRRGPGRRHGRRRRRRRRRGTGRVHLSREALPPRPRRREAGGRGARREEAGGPEAPVRDLMAYTFDQLVAYARQAGFPPDQAPTAAAVALAESSGNPDATHANGNRSTDFGLWQINSVHGQLLAGQNWRDPVANARMAFSVWQGSGWRAWTTYNTGAYRRYLNGTAPGGGGGGGLAALVPGLGGALGAPAATPGGVPAAAGGGGFDPFAGITAALDGIGSSFQGIAGAAAAVQKLALPQTWVRIMAGAFGIGFLGFGVVMLMREVRNG